MIAVLFLANKPWSDCQLIAKEVISDETDFESMVFQSELKLKEEVKRDNHAFIGCLIQEGLSLSEETKALITDKNQGCQFFEGISF